MLFRSHVVTVRDGGIQLAAIPVGAVMDPKQFTGQMSDDVELLNDKLRPTNLRGLEFGPNGMLLGTLAMEFTNPASRPVELTVLPSLDDGYSFLPDHQHAKMEPGATATIEFAVRRAGVEGQAPKLPDLELRIDYLAPDQIGRAHV